MSRSAWWELTSWEVALMGVDFVGVNLVGGHKINSEIASEAILGQKQSRSSYMARIQFLAVRVCICYPI